MVKLEKPTVFLVSLAMWFACSTEPMESNPVGEGGSGGSEPPPHGCAAEPLPGSIRDGRWSERFVAPGLSGRDGYGPRVHDLAVDPEGRLVAVGYFSFAGKDPVPSAARWTGTDWEPLVPGWEDIPPHFSAIAIGEDGAIALATRNALTGMGEVILVRDGDAEAIGAFQGGVRKLHWQGERLWMAGVFTMTEGPEHLAIWEAGSWTEAPGGNPDLPVLEIVEEEGSIVVAGAFESIGGIQANKMAIWDGATWTANDLPIPGWVFSLVRDGDGAWVAAGHLMEDESTYGGVARQLEDGSWELLGGGLTNGWIPGVVTAIARHEGSIYAAGCFRENAEGEPVPPIVRWDGTSWVPAAEVGGGVIRPWYDRNLCGDEGPQSFFETAHQRMLSVEDRLYLGGAFAGVGDTPANTIAVLAEEAWAPLGVGSDDVVMGWFMRMETGGPDCTLYAAGTISHVGTEPLTSPLLRWKDGWEPFGPPTPEGLECASHAVSEDERVFMGCRVRSEDLEDPGTAHLFELTADEWIPLGEIASGSVFDLEFDAAGKLWIAGGDIQGFVARWDGAAIEIVDDTFDGPVIHLAVEPGAPEPEVIVAGPFAHRGGEALRTIARFDGERWHPMGQGLADVSALAWGGKGIFMGTIPPMGGLFPMDDGDSEEPRQSFVLARWTGSGWEELGTTENGLPPVDEENPGHAFWKLVPTRDGLIAVGDVQSEQGPIHAVYWDGERFVDVGGGVGSIGLDTAAVTPAGIFFGGLIATVDPTGAVRPSVGAALFEWK